MSSGQPPRAIIDTSVLLSLYHLNLLESLKLLYRTVRVPRKVEEEFLINNEDENERSKRFNFLMDFYEQQNSWFIQCTEYGSDLVQIYLTDKRLDEGEAEVFAQNQSFDSTHELLLDEKAGRNVAKSEYVKHHGVLYVLANLDHRYKCCNYYECIVSLQDNRIGRFTSEIINKVYRIVGESIYMN